MRLLYNSDNMQLELKHNSAQVIFADYVYENLDFSWVDKYWQYLKTGGLFIAMTDYHSAAEYKVYTQQMLGANLVNWLVWKNEWGRHNTKQFAQVHDDIIIFSKGMKYKFYGERVQVEKATAKSKGLNPSGRTTKLATSVITDICLTTVAKERIKKADGSLVRWQKPKELVRRLVTPFIDEGELIVDPFMGVGTAGEVAFDLGCDYIGIENDYEPFSLAKTRLDSLDNSSGI
jgi:DNA modification methylase